MTAKTILCISVLLAGCGPEPDMQMYKQTMNPERPAIRDNTRIQVSRVGVFADDLAYSGKRGVYIIVDTETGNEFIGVSGVGVSEIGSHSCGKGCVTEDER